MKQSITQTTRFSETTESSASSARRAGRSREFSGTGLFQRLAKGSFGVVLAAWALTGCGSDGAEVGSNAPLGTLYIEGELPTSGFLVEQNKAGNASAMFIQNVAWGRLVDVADIDGTVRHRDFVVGEDVRTDGVDFEVLANPITDQITVRILHEFATAPYVAALKRSEQNLTPVQSKSLSPSELPPFTVVPRNAAVVVRFDDILDAHYSGGVWRDSKNQLLVAPTSGQLKSNVVRVVTGNPPNLPFEARIFVDPNHGDVYERNGQMAFHPTRIIIDMAVSETEAGASNPPLGINSIGLPQSVTTMQANVALRIPSRIEPQVGQNVLLTNPSNKGLSFSGNGANDGSSPTNDVVRAFRSGNGNDVNNGFLFDDNPPVLVGSLTVVLEDDNPGDPIPGVTNLGGGQFLIRQMVYQPAFCASALKLGQDVLDQGGTRAIVLDGQQDGAIIRNLLVQVVAPLNGVITLGTAQFQTAFDPDADQAVCFLRFSPNAASPPNQGVSKASQIFVRFNEPMDPSNLGAFDTMTLTRKSANSPSLTNFDFVVGSVQSSSDLREFAFVPQLPLDRTQGEPTGTYYFNLTGGQEGPTDLAGNPVDLQTLAIPFVLDSTEPASVNAGVVLRFSTPNEIIFNQQDADEGWGEVRQGQLLFDFNGGRILPRPVNRFSAAADRDKPVPSVMTVFPPGVQTPLSPLGSKLQALWRYVDVGFSLTDETNYNVDVEGMAWAPVGGSVVSDSYDEFSIRLAHSKRLPDEIPDPMTLFPIWPLSGLEKTYNNNYLDLANDPGTIVHSQEKGYTVSPAAMFTATSGTFMQPFPLNRNLPVSQWATYTWRDTALLARGGPQGPGAIQAQENFIVFGGTGITGQPYPQNQVPTVGLPLLMEFRCYPDTSALGLNAFDISLAVNSSARPNFRAFSTGGFDTNNNPVPRNPDNQTEALGGFNPGSTPPGVPTQGLDNTFYVGQLELVTRISRSHSIWFNTNLTNPKYAQPVVEPRPNEQPSGTQVILAYRGATQVQAPTTGTGVLDNILTNPGNLDAYGQPIGTTGTVTFLNGLSTWRSSISQIDGARFFQFRITFIANLETNLTASVSALGFAYFE